METVLYQICAWTGPGRAEKTDSVKRARLGQKIIWNVQDESVQGYMQSLKF